MKMPEHAMPLMPGMLSPEKMAALRTPTARNSTPVFDAA